MRKTTKFIAAVLAGVFLYSAADAQMVSYKTVKDDPKDICNIVISVDVTGMDIGLRNMDGGALLGLGANGYANIKGRLGADANLRWGYLCLASMEHAEKIHKPIWFDAGGFLNLTDKLKNRMITVTLSSHTVGNTTYTKSITVPGTIRKLKGVRGGIISHTFPLKVNSSYNDDGYLPGASQGYVNASVTGIYAGIQGTKMHNLFINTDGYGMCGSTGMSRWYIDVFLLPLWTAGYDGKSYKDSITATPVATASNPNPGPGFKYNPIGWRWGYEIHPVETKRRKSEGRAMGLYVKMEVGKRPIEGGFIMMGCGFTVFRKKLTLLGYKKPEEEKNTFE